MVLHIARRHLIKMCPLLCVPCVCNRNEERWRLLVEELLIANTAKQNPLLWKVSTVCRALKYDIFIYFFWGGGRGSIPVNQPTVCRELAGGGPMALAAGVGDRRRVTCDR